MSTAISDPATSASTALDGQTPERDSSGLDWALIRRQIGGILRLEIRRNLLSRRSLALYFLAFAPVAILLIWALFPFDDRGVTNPTEAVATLFTIFFAGYQGTVIFLAALITFMSLFRSEILERSLHYYYLTPVRREVLVAGKYISALISACTVFAVATSTLFVLTCLPWGFSGISRYLWSGPGFGHLVTYVGIAILACAGYGAVFLLVGLFFRNPIVPAAAVWGWEALNPFLPAFLKKLSVVHYLWSLYPIPRAEGVFAVVAEPTPAWITVPGLLIFTAAVLVFAGWRARRMEISYGSD